MYVMYHHFIENLIDIRKLSSFASKPGAMINPYWLKLHLSRTNVHGPKDVRAIEFLLYLGTGFPHLLIRKHFVWLLVCFSAAQLFPKKAPTLKGNT